MIRGKTISGILLVNLATLFWATNIILGRYIRESIGPLTLTAARYLIASAVFAFLLKKLPEKERRPGRDLPLLAAMSLTGVVLFAPVLYLSLRYTAAVNVTLINGLGPLFTALLAALILKESFTAGQAAGALAALFGVVFLISGGSTALLRKADFNPGDFIVVAAVIIWAFYSVSGSRTMRDRSSLSATALSVFMGLPVLVVLAAVEMLYIPVALSLRLLLIVVYVGLVPAALGFSCWNAGVARLGAGGAMIFYNAMPVYGAVMGYLFLGEALGMQHIIGGAMIIAGGVTAALNRKKE